MGSAASTDTTATALSYAVYFLLKYPHTFRALKDEVRREFSCIDEITNVRLAGLPFLNAAIQEGMHLFH